MDCRLGGRVVGEAGGWALGGGGGMGFAQCGSRERPPRPVVCCNGGGVLCGGGGLLRGKVGKKASGVGLCIGGGVFWGGGGLLCVDVRWIMDS